jgi:hypothetical protein
MPAALSRQPRQLGPALVDRASTGAVPDNVTDMFVDGG